MVSINAYLDRILVDFKKYVNSDIELCNRKVFSCKSTQLEFDI